MNIQILLWLGDREKEREFHKTVKDNEQFTLFVIDNEM